jgi:ABC transporter substrate binding protein
MSGIVSASKVTRTVPLVMIGGTEDPVRLGLAESFARPGGNVTGFLLTADQDILGKRLQLLRDAAPGISRVGVMANPDSAGDAAELRMVPLVAERVGLRYRLFEVRTEGELDAVLAAAASDDLQALYVSWTPIFNIHRARIIAMASKLRRACPEMAGCRQTSQGRAIACELGLSGDLHGLHTCARSRSGSRCSACNCCPWRCAQTVAVPLAELEQNQDKLLPNLQARHIWLRVARLGVGACVVLH